MKKLQGVITALPTPFCQDGSLDKNALKKFVDFQIENGITALLPVGTTGESPTLTHEEHAEVIRLVIEQTAGRVPVICGTGSNSTAEAVSMTKQAAADGADYSLQVTPYYNKPGQEGIYRHFTAIADASPIPIILYNIAGRTGRNIETETVARLAEHPNIVGVKEASGSIAQAMDVIHSVPEDFMVFSGDDSLTLPTVAVGGDGIISVASNVIPQAMTEFTSAALTGDWETARRYNKKYASLFQKLFIDTNPVPVKYALARMGWMEEVYRLPLCPMNDNCKAILDAVLKELDLI
ncbi:MAG: 4-hydroxy-tetrahydrodipicolinate synthase [Spirochaetia bacterium]|nr:4-hydroxy-tetrahydrodipicolinate synthase [Spirochaetia bacterium]